MRAVQLCAPYVPDGTEGISKNVQALVVALKESGVDARLEAVACDLGALNHRRMLIRQSWLASKAARRALMDPSVNVVHYHTSLPSLARFARSAYATLPRGRRCGRFLVQLWNPHYVPSDGVGVPWRERWGHRLFNGARSAGAAVRGLPEIVVATRYQAAQLRGLGFAGRIHVVSSGVNTRLHRPASPSDQAAAREILDVHGDPLLLYYGHLSAWKGVGILLKALPEVFEALPKAHVLLAHTSYGRGGPRLNEALRDAHIESRVSLRGATYVPWLQAAADMCVLPTRAAVGTACPPNVLLESLSAGLPVVTTTVGSAPELVEEGQTGLLVPPNDPHALAQALIRVGSDPALRRRLGSASRRRMTESFDWAHVARRFQDLYRSEGASPFPASVRPVPLPALEATARSMP